MTRLLMPWFALMRYRLRRAGMDCNDQIFGVTHSGAMDEARLLQILASLPCGVTEIYLHPGTQLRRRHRTLHDRLPPPR